MNFLRLINNPQHLIGHFGEVFVGLEGMSIGNLTKILTINNSRASVAIKTKSAEYTFCYDRFYYFDEAAGRFSEYFTEIEIELEKGQPTEDSQLEKLAQSVSTIFSHNPHASSKLESGLNWMWRGSEPRESVCAVTFEIMEFGRRTLELQKQALQTLNHHTKEAIREIRGADAVQETGCIPTGDGMTLLFDREFESVISVLGDVQRRLKSDKNRKDTAFRVGIDIGEIFKFSDLNGNLNYGGGAMQMARQVTMLGRNWHILVTEKAYSLMNVADPIRASRRRYTIENGDEIEALNVYRPGPESFGNPADPFSKGMPSSSRPS